MRRDSRWGVGAAVVALVCGLSACGGSQPSGAPPLTATTSVQAPTSAAGAGSGPVPAAATSTADLTAAINGVAADLDASSAEATAADQGLAQVEADPTK